MSRRNLSLPESDKGKWSAWDAADHDVDGTLTPIMMGQSHRSKSMPMELASEAKTRAIVAMNDTSSNMISIILKKAIALHLRQIREENTT